MATNVGLTGSGVGDYALSTDDAVCIKIDGTPAVDGALVKIHIYCFATKPISTARFALYSDDSGSPGSRLVMDATGQTISTSSGWYTSSDLDYTVTAGTQYWVGLVLSLIHI